MQMGMGENFVSFSTSSPGMGGCVHISGAVKLGSPSRHGIDVAFVVALVKKKCMGKKKVRGKSGEHRKERECVREK